MKDSAIDYINSLFNVPWLSAIYITVTLILAPCSVLDRHFLPIHVTYTRGTGTVDNHCENLKGDAQFTLRVSAL